MTADTTSNEYEELKTELRAILISSQQGCTELQLITDFKRFAGRTIPYREMGYTSLLDLLMSMPDVASIANANGSTVIHGVANENTAHIKQLVRGQKTSKKVRATRGGMNRNTINSRTNGSTTIPRNRQVSYTTNYQSFQPYNNGSNFQKNSSGVYNQNPVEPQQVIKTSYSSSSAINNSAQIQYSPILRKTVESYSKTPTSIAAASFPPKTSLTPSPGSIAHSVIESTRETPTKDDASSTMDDDITCTIEDILEFNDRERAKEYGEQIIFLRKRIRKLLLKYPSGVWLTSIHKLYKKTFNEEFILKDYHLSNLLTFFDCISDFVDAKRDRVPDSTDRILSLKQKYSEVTEQEKLVDQMTSATESIDIDNNENTMIFQTNEINRPLVDRSSFVPLDFQYEQLKYESNELFDGFLVSIENPWIIHIGNTQFIPERDRMMSQLQDHYNQMSNETLYIIPFEQIDTNLCCIYCDKDSVYYRASIIRIDPINDTDIISLGLYLVDFGDIINNIRYHINSTNIKFLHRNFSTLRTAINDCRLANIHYLPAYSRWQDDARDFIVDFIQDTHFRVEVVGYKNSFYYIYLWIEQKSINELLVQHNYAVEFDDTTNLTFDLSPSNIETTTRIQSNINNVNIDERLLSRQESDNIEFNVDGNDFKHFIISIEHAYYFVKHPFTKRPCLPCFEVARLLSKDENYLPQLNLIRETEIRLLDPNRKLFDDLRCLSESSKCPHINRNDDKAIFKIYDLSAVRDYLRKIKFKEGDVIDAFGQEYDNYDRPGYWNEVKNSYQSQDDIQSYQEGLNKRKSLLDFRKEQLVSFSTAYNDISSPIEISNIEQEVRITENKINSTGIVHLMTTNHHNLPSASTMKTKPSNNKMRETLYRIARPFDQQFSLNVCFNHQLITNETLNEIYDDDIEEKFNDLYRITKNVISFFIIESELLDDKSQKIIDTTQKMLSNLIEVHVLFEDRIEIYNYCLQVVRSFQPIIRNNLQKADLVDLIY